MMWLKDDVIVIEISWRRGIWSSSSWQLETRQQELATFADWCKTSKLEMLGMLLFCADWGTWMGVTKLPGLPTEALSFPTTESSVDISIKRLVATVSSNICSINQHLRLSVIQFLAWLLPLALNFCDRFWKPSYLFLNLASQLSWMSSFLYHCMTAPEEWIWVQDIYFI